MNDIIAFLLPHIERLGPEHLLSVSGRPQPWSPSPAPLPGS